MATPAKPVSTGVAVNGPQVTAGSKQKGSGANTTQQQGTQGFDPVQLASTFVFDISHEKTLITKNLLCHTELVAQHIPQVQAMLTPPPNQAVGSASAQVVPPATTQSHLNNNPFLDPANQAAYQIPNAATVPSQDAMTNGAVYSVASSNPLHVAQQLHISTQPSADDLECFIPGCGKSVRVDAQGMKTSNYCSMRHREYVDFFTCCYFLNFILFPQGRLLLQV